MPLRQGYGDEIPIVFPMREAPISKNLSGAEGDY